MREIEFKGLRKDTNEWLSGYLILQNDKSFIYPDTSFPDLNIRLIEVLPETVGQFTGLLDKNGKKIFEGDIVKYKYESPYMSKPTIEYNATAEYDTCNPCFVLKEISENMFGKLEYDWVKTGCATIKVIGNIHENKELLK